MTFSKINSVTALFVRSDSIYKQLVEDCYDEQRDAVSYQGTNPVVAHPPCRAFSRLRGLAKPGRFEKHLAYFAVNCVREWGGVLEHPECSTLWKEMNLPYPGAKQDKWGGYSIKVNQSDFGHKARKPTWLYICGTPKHSLPHIPISFSAIEYTISSSKNRHRTGKKEVSKKEREATPVDFALWLIQVASMCTKENKIYEPQT